MKRRLGLDWDDWTETFNYKLSRYRADMRELLGRKRSVSQGDFGYIFGLTQTQVSKYERGIIPVPIEVQRRIEHAIKDLKAEKNGTYE